MIFFASSRPVLFLIAGIAIAGLWLTARLYRGRLKSLPALFTGLAWILLALFCAQPFLKLNPESYHPPVIVLAVDESPSYALLGARQRADSALLQAKRHYEAKGFTVLELFFAERAQGKAGSARGDLGTLTRASTLRRHLDSLAWPNVQGLFLLSDGRFEDDDAAQGWPAPVFPLEMNDGAGGMSGEAQGERAILDAGSENGEGATLELTWRAAGKAVVEIRSGEKIVWSAPLRGGNRDEASVPEVTTEFELPSALIPALTSESGAGVWTVRVRPAGPARNPSLKNDTVEIEFRGLNRAREIFLRPLASLEERGLVDALSAPEAADAPGVTAVFPGEARPSAGDLLWMNAARARAIGASALSAARIEYHLQENAGAAGAMFGPDGRVSWRGDGTAFLPSGVVRLADLGAESMRLKAPDGEVEALAWAEEGGRKGLLFWRAGERVFGIATPPLWRAGFRAGAARGEVGAAGAWVRGAAAWARAQGGARVEPPRLMLAGRPFAIEAKFGERSSVGKAESKNSIRYDLINKSGEILDSARGTPGVRFDSLIFNAGLHEVSIVNGAETLWGGALRVRDPLDAELSRLGNDAETFAEIAAVSGGKVVSFGGAEKISWPEFAGGQMRETRFRSAPLLPALPTTFVIALLLCAAWALRKRLQLD